MRMVSRGSGHAMFKRFIRDDSGATALEYGLLVALIGATAMLAFMSTGHGLSNLFTTVATAMGG